jgi:hypothetical protein
MGLGGKLEPEVTIKDSCNPQDVVDVHDLDAGIHCTKIELPDKFIASEACSPCRAGTCKEPLRSICVAFWIWCQQKIHNYGSRQFLAHLNQIRVQV